MVRKGVRQECKTSFPASICNRGACRCPPCALELALCKALHSPQHQQSLVFELSPPRFASACGTFSTNTLR